MHNSFNKAFKNIKQDNWIKIQDILIHVCKVNISYIKYETANVRISWHGCKSTLASTNDFDDHAMTTVFQYYWALISEDDNIPNKLQEQAHQFVEMLFIQVIQHPISLEQWLMRSVSVLKCHYTWH